MTSLPSLIAELASAPGPSVELDARIYDAVGRPGDDDPQYFASLHGDCPPAYTHSIDAAMSLVPEWWFIHQLGQTDHGNWFIRLAHGFPSNYDRNETAGYEDSARVSTPALALCIAALKARARSQEPGTSEEEENG